MNLDLRKQDMTAMRHAMVASQLRTNAVSDPRVVAAMDLVPREAFLPETVAELAYRDTVGSAVATDGRRTCRSRPDGLLTQAELRHNGSRAADRCCRRVHRGGTRGTGGLGGRGRERSGAARRSRTLRIGGSCQPSAWSMRPLS